MFGIPTLAVCLYASLDMLSLELPQVIAGSAVAIYGALGVLALFYASARTAGKRPLWDLIAGTMVRYRTTRTAAK
jgi:hypothetical protein